MDRELTPEEIVELLPAYALDAVDDDERAAIDEYLATHPDARDEASGLQIAASMLAHTGGAPPAGVWERLESIIAGDVPASAVAPPIPIGAARAREAAQAQRAWAESPSVARRWRWLAAAAAVVALVFGGLWIAERAGDGGGASDTAALARTAMTAPGARQVALTDESGVTLATAVVTRDGTGYLTSTARLPRAAVGRTYQLWGISRTGTISLGVLGRSPRTVAFKAAVPTESLAITTEIAGGVPVSHNAPDAVGDLA